MAGRFKQGDLVKIKSIGCVVEVIQQSGGQCAVELSKKCVVLREDGEEEDFEIMERVIVTKDDIELVCKAESRQKDNRR